MSVDRTARILSSSTTSLVTISMVTSVTLVLMVLVLAWGRSQHNGISDNADGFKLQTAAKERLSSLREDLQTWVRATQDGAAAEIATGQRFTDIFLVDPSRNIAVASPPKFKPSDEYSKFAPFLADIVAAANKHLDLPLRGALPDAEVPEAPTRPRDAGYISTDNGGFAATAVPYTLGESRLMAVGLRQLDRAFLNEVAYAAELGSIGVVAQGSQNADLASNLIDSGNPNGPWIEWRADRSSDRVVGMIGTTLVSFTALLAGLLALSTTRNIAEKESDAKRRAGHDALSNLPNRAFFIEQLTTELNRAKETGGAFGLFYLDLDRFKEINDDYGHEAGDNMIVAVAKRLHETLRATDVVARLGGDEFAILQPNVKSDRDCEQLAARLLFAMREPFDIGGVQVRIGVSIGLAIGPRDARAVDPLMNCADIALYRAKTSGRNRFVSFNPEMAVKDEDHKTTEHELRLAIERDELVLHYQPIVTPDGSKILAVEALVRWKHPRRGLIGPNEFITLAESRGLIIPLGEWVLNQACKDAQNFGQLVVAVNVSAIQFRHRNFVHSVERILNAAGLDPSRLELELTETVVIDDADDAERAMIDLRSMGVRLALDDFGTGYSSLIYLRRFAFDKIKIDRSFLEAVESTGESAIIVHSMVHLGRALGLTVTAEGVETAEQHRFLQALGAHELQGFLFSRPVPAANIIEICKNNGIMPRRVPSDDVESSADQPLVLIAGAA